MKKHLFILFLISVNYGFACSCTYSELSKKDYDSASYIVTGKVLKVEVNKENNKKL
ncbi:MAG: hypothetical protein HWD82_06785 [Flavobacteriaceae bacterium]|nr:hypothetical protein [Flavobacteriaceae bacterium]